MKIIKGNVYYASKCRLTPNVYADGPNGAFYVESVCIKVNENEYVDILGVYTKGNKATRYSTKQLNDGNIYLANLRPFYTEDLSSEVTLEEIFYEKVNREYGKEL